MLTLLIVAFCTVVWFVQPDWAMHGAAPSFEALFTAPFYHKDSDHLMTNMLLLLVMGSDFERHYGKWMLSLFVLCTAVASTLAETMWHWDSNGLLFGASGFVAALVTAFARDVPRSLATLPIVVPVLWSAADGDAGVAHGAHLSGLLLGLLFTFTAYLPRALEPTRQAADALPEPVHPAQSRSPSLE